MSAGARLGGRLAKSHTRPAPIAALGLAGQRSKMGNYPFDVAPREEIGSESIFPWERNRMTVCIAALCENASQIVTCVDTKLSSEYGSSETGYKMQLTRSDWMFLTAGNEPDIIGLTRCAEQELNSAEDVDETNLKILIGNAIRKWKNAKADMFVSGRFGISYEEFMEHGKSRLPDDVFRNTVLDIAAISIGATIIVCGFHESVPHICQTAANGNVLFRDQFAVIGEAQFLAASTLLKREQHAYLSSNRTLYNVFEATKYAEGVPTVGKATKICVAGPDELRFLNQKAFDHLEKMYAVYGPKEITEEIAFNHDMFN